MRLVENKFTEYPTMHETRAHLKEQLDLYLGTIKALLDAGGMGANQNNFRTKDSKDHAPKLWSGDKDNISFVEFLGSVKNWADTLHEHGVEMLELVEGSQVPIEENKLDEQAFPDIRKFSKLLFAQLSDKLTGDPIKFVNKQARGHGLAAWRELVNWYDPRSNVDKAATYAKIVSPIRRAKDIKQTIEMMNVWEQLVTNYEVRHGIIEDVGKITGLKQILPENIIDHHFRGKIYEKFQEFRQDVTNFLNDRTKAKEDNRMDIDSLIAQLQPHLETSQQECCDHPSPPDENENIANKLLAAIGWQKGKSKGESGYGPQWPGKGANGWRPDPRDHQKGDWGKGHWGDWGKGSAYGKSWNESPKGKGKGKSDIKGKGKGKTSSMTCYNCGGKGHKARDCPTARINSLEDEAPQLHDDEDQGSEACWCLTELLEESIAACEDKERGDDDDGDYTEVISKKQKKAQRTTGTKMKDGVMMVEEMRGTWARIEAGLDSCAAINVCPVGMFSAIPKVETEASMSGKKYSAANGSTILNEGEKTIEFVTNCGKKQKVKFQLAKVTKILLSADKVNRAGFDVDLNSKDPKIIDKKTGQR